MENTTVKKTVLSALCVALCVVLPMAFHMIPNAGTIFLPMHIPVLLCGLLCGWQYGLLCGLAGPLIASLTTGMPPAAILPAMMVECAVYGCTAGLLMARLHNKRVYQKLYISMVSAMVLGRIVSGIAKALIFAPGTSFTAWATVSFVTCLPGIAIQLTLIPAIFAALTKARLIPQTARKETAK